ncbi:MAG: HsdM family class I SAM-dependent methyltransferase [Promethearchaeota archaeon]
MSKHIYNLNKDFERFHKSLKIRNKNIINNVLTSIQSYEELFLSNYKERKKEGVYFTDDSISKFIFTKVLNLFIEKKTGIQNINNSYDYSKLNSKEKDAIYKILLNIKICDPACGSGIFLLNAAEILYNFIKSIRKDFSSLKIKINILKNIFGFDINSYSLKLSILKLFNWIYTEKECNLLKTFEILNSNLKIANSLKIEDFLNYDIIIGNPPYGNILTKEEKLILKKENAFYNDIYCLFILKVLNWCNGIIGLLVPKSFLLRQSYFVFREMLFLRANILEIYDMGSNLFKKATNEVQILIFERKEINKGRNLQIYDYPNKNILTYKNQEVDFLKICFNKNCPLCIKSKKIYVYTFENRCPYCNFKTRNLYRVRIKPNKKLFQIICKIEKTGNFNYLNPVDFPKMIRGEEHKGLKQVKRIVQNNTQNSCYFVSAKEDFHYYYLDKNKSFNIEEISSNSLKGRNYEFYLKPKLLIKHNNIVPETIYTEEKICFTSSIYSLLHSDKLELKYLSALLNSALMQFYCIYGINNQKDTTINLNQYMIRHLPIVKANADVKSEISIKVNEIISIFQNTKGEINEKIRVLCKSIDNLIFDIYSIEHKDRELIVSTIKNQIKFYKNIYCN